MSSSPTERTSTTGSSINSGSDHVGGSGGSSPWAGTVTTGSSINSGSDRGPGFDVVACGALAGHIRDIAARRGWPVTVHPLPARLHNRPAEIPPQTERVVASLPPTPPAPDG